MLIFCASSAVYVGRIVEESISRDGCRPPDAFSRPLGCGRVQGAGKRQEMRDRHKQNEYTLTRPVLFLLPWQLIIPANSQETEVEETLKGHLILNLEDSVCMLKGVTWMASTYNN